MPDDHPHHVALWFAEVFGGPPHYTEEHGGYPHMMRKHLGLALTEAQRARWVQLIGLAADDVGASQRPGVPLRLPRLCGVGDADRAGQLAARGGAAAGGAGATLGLGRGAAVSRLSRPARGRRGS